MPAEGIPGGKILTTCQDMLDLSETTFLQFFCDPTQRYKYVRGTPGKIGHSECSLHLCFHSHHGLRFRLLLSIPCSFTDSSIRVSPSVTLVQGSFAGSVCKSPRAAFELVKKDRRTSRVHRNPSEGWFDSNRSLVQEERMMCRQGDLNKLACEIVSNNAAVSSHESHAGMP